jgi:uncharacterized protein YcbK (DUF882 family)
MLGGKIGSGESGRGMNRRVFLSVAAAAAAVPCAAWAIPAAPARRRLNLVNAHTGETFEGPYRDDDGPIINALKELSYFLRDFRCGEEITIDVHVLDFLCSVLEAVGDPRVTILSAYRTPATNEMLARTRFGVAEHSQHMYGRALDIYLPSRLPEAMLAARAMQRGGVGWYPNSRFIHLDAGPVRNWTLGGSGLGRLLLDGKASEYYPEPIGISAKGEFFSRRSGRPVTPTDRLAIHNLLQRALRLPGR